MSLLHSLFGGSQSSVKSSKTLLDLVTYTAGLASNSTDIDPALDKVRSITASLAPGQQPSAADNQVLTQVYLQIEQYLITKESLRTFTKQELRARIAPELRAQIEAHESNNKGAGANNTVLQ
jgi:hypothetical protein